MPKIRFKVTLKKYNVADKSSYAVAKALGISQGTARRYLAQDEVIVDMLDSSVIAIAAYFGVSADRIKEFVEVIEDSPNPGESKTPLTLHLETVA